MLRKLINTYLENNIEDKNDVALLFSGGMDSLSILLSCLDVGIKPNLYVFRLNNYVSEDSIYSKKISQIYNLNLYEIVLDVNKINLISDIEKIVKLFNVKKKTQIQCIQPFLYVIPKIKENYILTGLCADDLYGTPRSMAKHAKNIEYFKEIRINAFNNEESSSYKFIKQLSEMNNKRLIAPYKESIDIYNYMISKNYKELHSPKQKYIMYSDYEDELTKNNIYRRNSNLQCNSKIREWHDELLKSEINSEGFKSVVGIYNKIHNKLK